MTTITSIDPVQEAARQLARSETGRDALRHLLDWFDHSGLKLDARNQEAVCTLLAGAWGTRAGSTLDAMREAVPALEASYAHPHQS